MTKSCGNNKCSASCNDGLCASGKETINFESWINTMVQTGYFVADNFYDNGIPLPFSMRNVEHGSVKIPINANKIKNLIKSRADPVNPVNPVFPVVLYESYIIPFNDTWVLLADVTDPENATLVYQQSQLIVGHTYMVVTFYYGNTEGDFINAGMTPLSFVYSTPANINLINDPHKDMTADEVIALVSYLNERINCLKVPCCVKQKITDAVMAVLNKFLSPADTGSTNFLMQSLAGQQFTSFCDDHNIIPECGPIYVANTIMNDYQRDSMNQIISSENALNFFDQAEIDEIANRINNLGFTLNLLRTVQYYLQTYMSTKCCCKKGCEEGDHNMSASKACKFVFDRFCVVDVPLPYYDVMFPNMDRKFFNWFD